MVRESIVKIELITLNKVLDLIISVVTYNSDIKILKNLINQINEIKEIKIKLVIIDNNSNPIYFNNLIKLHKNVISAGSNLGYGKAHNLLKSISPKSKYFLVLNPDIQLQDNVIINCFNFLEIMPDHSLISPILKEEDNTYYNIENRTFSFMEILKRRIFNSSDKLHINELKKINDNFINTNFISGAFMFFRSKIFESIGGFDNRFFMYFEDVDICKRTLLISNIAILTNTFTYHKRERASYKSLK